MTAVYCRRMSLHTRITLGIGILLACMLATALYVTRIESAVESVDLSAMTPDEKSAHWTARIQEVGDAQAYEEFKASTPPVKPNEMHWEAHIFGDALYDLRGLAGIETCDTHAEYACFHAFMIRAVDEFGPSAAGKLHAVCIEQLGEFAHECLHGMGHGILGVLGHTKEDLDRAVDICDDYPDPNPAMSKYGCTSGAVMEYNMYTMNSGRETPRPFSNEIALEPCRSMEGQENRRACTFWQPQWWIASLKHEPPLVMAQHIGKLCRAMSVNDTELYHICIQGIGNRISSVIDFDPSRTAETCAAIDPDLETRYICHIFTAFRFSRYFPLEKAYTACDGLPDNDAKRCRTQLKDYTAYYDQILNY